MSVQYKGLRKVKMDRSVLREEFVEIRFVSNGVVFSKDEMETYTYNYWLSASGPEDLLVVSETDDEALALKVIRSVSAKPKANTPTVLELAENARGVTHVLIVPSKYHGYLRGVEGLDRNNLFLCIPIYGCEFSGDETIEEFKVLHLDVVPILNWRREKFPKLRVYFDNPRTGAGTTESGAFFKMSDLLREVDEMSGVSEGFLEITNWRGECSRCYRHLMMST